jgi:Flp pilus assembly protein protease CpaA
VFEGNGITTYLVIVWLIFCSWQDIKSKKINIILIVVGFLIIFLSSIITNNISIENRAAGLSLGMCLLILNRITRNQIGVGDGLIISILGLSLGFKINAFILVYSLIFSTIFSIILLVLRKVNGKTSFPFIPFILASYLGVLLI